jgi:ubiquinone/menaquinone biosynthesis C-methylase UbiE
MLATPDWAQVVKGLSFVTNLHGDPYAEIAEFYDLEHDELVADIEMYLQFVESAGDPVLELACGTGRVTVPIAKAGYRIVGADVSDAMLSRARIRADSQVKPDRPTIVQASMTEAHTLQGGPFGVVIMALGALSHLSTQDLQLAALRSAHRALDPRGVLLVDVFHASPARLHALDGGLGADGRWELDSGTSVERYSTHTVHPATQNIHTRILYDAISAGGNVRRVSASMTQRYVSPGELALLLQMAGFQDMMFYGGYELEPFEDNSDRLIVAAEKTKTS